MKRYKLSVIIFFLTIFYFNVPDAVLSSPAYAGTYVLSTQMPVNGSDPMLTVEEAGRRVSDAPPEASDTVSATPRIYGIGSVSKVYTAAAVMKLSEEGLIDLDLPLTVYMPDFEMADDRYQDITPRMLLNHSSGFMGMSDLGSFLLGDNRTINHDNFLEMLSTQRLKHDPGELSVYSNDSFTMAELLVERVSGMSFTAYLQETFWEPLGLKETYTPQSNFDRSLLAPIYWQGRELLPSNVNTIGSGGIYASAADLCLFGNLFTRNGPQILSDESIREMGSIHHARAMVADDADTVFRYGLGWDAVNAYPFNILDIHAFSKGGNTGNYNTNLTVLPEYDLSVAVVSSGPARHEQLIAQEIVLEVLKEEGLIDGGFSLTLPEYDTSPLSVPDSLKVYAGLYDAGATGGLFTVSFEDDCLLLTTVNTSNEKTMRFVYNQKGEFVSIDGDYFTTGIRSNQGGTRGIGRLSFTVDEKGQTFLLMSAYESVSGLGQTAIAHPGAQKLEPLSPDVSIWTAWVNRQEQKYFLLNEPYSSYQYLDHAAYRPMTDERSRGYLALELSQGKGSPGTSYRIIDSTLARGFQKTPTMSGRDIKDISITVMDGFEILHINEHQYIEEAALPVFSSPENTGGQVTITTESSAEWFRIDESAGDQNIFIDMPEESSVFLYDEDLQCIYSSLELNFDPNITLPDHGYIAFVGQNKTFSIESSNE